MTDEYLASIQKIAKNANTLQLFGNMVDISNFALQIPYNAALMTKVSRGNLCDILFNCNRKSKLYRI